MASSKPAWAWQAFVSEHKIKKKDGCQVKHFPTMHEDSGSVGAPYLCVWICMCVHLSSLFKEQASYVQCCSSNLYYPLLCLLYIHISQSRPLHCANILRLAAEMVPLFGFLHPSPKPNSVGTAPLSQWSEP